MNIGLSNTENNSEQIPVLFIETGGDIRGGGQISLINILKHINKICFKPYLVCSSDGTLRDEVNEFGIYSEVIEIKSLKRLNIFSFLTAILKLCRFIKKWNIKIIHSNAAATRDTFYSAIAAKLMGVPFIWHVRVVESAGILDRLLAFLSDRVIVISQVVKEKFYWVKKENKLIVIYNGIDLDEFRLNIDGGYVRKELKISNEEIVVGVVGQLIPWKGHKYFLEAAKTIKEKISNVKFFIVGDEVPKGSGYRKELEEFALQKGLIDNVIFTGFRADIPKIMNTIDIFVLPSIREPFGRVLIEAMAMAKPVIATNAGGVPEIVVDNETGILVPPEEPKAIANAIVFLIENRARAKEMGKAGRERVEKLFTIQKSVGNIEDVYIEILKIKQVKADLMHP